jgi:hypothetical protein
VEPGQFRTAYRLSIIILILAAIASAGGLLLKGLYRDNALVTVAWRGNDLVTLFVVIPIFAIALTAAKRGAVWAYLVWMGTLDYMLYNYAFYLFGAAFNWFFLIYAALLSLSIFALIFGLAKLDTKVIAQRFRAKTPVRWISAYLLVLAIGLSLIYLIQSIRFIVTGQLPSVITRTGHLTSIVFALDLTLLIPFMILGAFWLLQRKPWGYILAGILTFKGPAYTLVLALSSGWAARMGLPNVATEIPIWVGLTLFGLIANGLLLGNLTDCQQTSKPIVSISQPYRRQ